jgi:hypothetical protein
MYIRRHSWTVTSSATGGVTAYSSFVATGTVLSIRYSTGTGWGTSCIGTFTGEVSGTAIFAKTIAATAATWLPRQLVVTTTGGAVAHSTGAGVTLVREPVYLANERIKLVATKCTTASNPKSATFHVVMG